MPSKKAAKKKNKQAAVKPQPAAPPSASSPEQPRGGGRSEEYVFGTTVRPLAGALQQLCRAEYADRQIVVVRFHRRFLICRDSSRVASWTVT
jgi:hypothetical protein